LELLHLTANSFSIPFSTLDGSYQVGASIGYHHFTVESFQETELTPSLALERVDQAMYFAKKSGVSISNWSEAIGSF